VPRLEHLDLLHDAIGEKRRRRKVRQALELRDDKSRGIELRRTFAALPDVRLEGRDAESRLVVEEQVDFVWK
jgi:hypothetical protein